MKLHLGCGQRYIKGYVNIDFPQSEHTVQEKSVADIQTNILDLKYQKGSIEEVRLHHLFEHFTRPIAFALLSAWNNWLNDNGILHIEVPDLYKTASIIFNPFKSFNKKMIATRHIFGSHEASWAIHCEGWTTKSLKIVLESYGFKVIKILKNKWRGTYNFEIISQKIKTLNNDELLQTTESLLKNYLLSFNDEKKLFYTWLDMYKNQLNKNLN
ncbi:MAG: hypothetical protein A2086_00990 [Spirochaetes bacterium GWD1_27_9]|nr:MAG: hypothetical protein A2Y34_02490 [Spirochaetes bacterium GWC1_27_15]OHD33628.1 MAG: hypothetical protein A2086_00990 [Spirochaetes bacterium GWD1_27_9]